jgi:hypothetical protein
VNEEGGAVRANDLIVGAHVQIDVGMIHRGPCPHTLKLLDADMYFLDPNIVVKVGNPDFRHTRPPVYRAAARYPKERAVQGVTCTPPQYAAPSPILFGMNDLFQIRPMLSIQPRIRPRTHPLPPPNFYYSYRSAKRSAEFALYKTRENTRGPALCFRWLRSRNGSYTDARAALNEA